MIRTILTPDTQQVSFIIPEDYIGKELEAIAFTTNEGKESKAEAKKNVSFNALSIDTKDFAFNRDDANER